MGAGQFSKTLQHRRKLWERLSADFGALNQKSFSFFVKLINKHVFKNPQDFKPLYHSHSHTLILTFAFHECN